ncbi:hypothetical protein QCD60_23030 [Pokkaliibacter sp. MBI-7]|uniref:hypothetical protein n=1 Tax=Pokkaliibacter sp. MBI-7 TaxID=3040600 RepID=UPI0024488E4F|nr:hypothetical protein [Pokkaliibacter sp. MBI-7]MDH2435388.1 hypothetical protein [Pokkaliibacter sp. MBI-7]MDH2435395.1 hypothetical protein [Pokkaliibacter sp. MBI-7]MDH2435402.1 hypothetical protein [Pokkaliibacter sp. MBI-7]
MMPKNQIVVRKNGMNSIQRSLPVLVVALSLFAGSVMAADGDGTTEASSMATLLIASAVAIGASAMTVVVARLGIEAGMSFVKAFMRKAFGR